MYKTQFIRQLTVSLHIKNSKYQKVDIAQQYIDTIGNVMLRNTKLLQFLKLCLI